MNTLKEDFILAKAGNEEAIEAILKRFSSLMHKNRGETENTIKIVIKNV